MPALLLCGNYTPAAWDSIRSDPGFAPSAIESVAQAAGSHLTGYWFAFDEFDFYGVIEGDDTAALAAVRHRLMAGGAFVRLIGEPLLAPHELIAACTP